MEGGGGGGGGRVSGRDIGIVRINRQQPPAQAVQVNDSATAIKPPAYVTKGRRKKNPKTPDPNHKGRQNNAQVGKIWRAKHQIYFAISDLKPEARFQCLR